MSSACFAFHFSRVVTLFALCPHLFAFAILIVRDEALLAYFLPSRWSVRYRALYDLPRAFAQVTHQIVPFLVGEAERFPLVGRHPVSAKTSRAFIVPDEWRGHWNGRLR